MSQSNVYYIVEHPSRGCHVDTVRRDDGKLHYKCSYSIRRTDPKVRKYYDYAAAEAQSKEIKGSYVMRVVPLSRATGPARITRI